MQGDKVPRTIVEFSDLSDKGVRNPVSRQRLKEFLVSNLVEGLAPVEKNQMQPPFSLFSKVQYPSKTVNCVLCALSRSEAELRGMELAF